MTFRQKKLIREKILKEFNEGAEPMDLAVKYKFSLNWIYRIIRQSKNEKS